MTEGKKQNGKYRHELKYKLNYSQYISIKKRLASVMELDKNVGENGGKPNFGGNPPDMNGNPNNSRTNENNAAVGTNLLHLGISLIIIIACIILAIFFKRKTR